RRLTEPAAGLEGPQSYDRVARSLHWLIAALAVIVVLLGWTVGDFPRNTPERDRLLLLHHSVGLVILAAMVFRLGWRWRHPAPPLPPSVGRTERAVARCRHGLLYLIFLAMPIAGYANAAAAGHPVGLFGIVSIPPLLPKTAACHSWRSQRISEAN